jgi:hypothetical protein
VITVYVCVCVHVNVCIMLMHVYKSQCNMRTLSSCNPIIAAQYFSMTALITLGAVKRRTLTSIKVLKSIKQGDHD